MRVAVCIPTCRRPRWLTACLDSLTAQQIEPATADVAVFVVDNDPAESAKDVVASREGRLGRWSLTYVHEPCQGISFARNRAVAAALDWEADFVAFLDDDESAGTSWLAELVAAQRCYKADIVAGPVIPTWEQGVERWASEGRFFERPRYPTGTWLDCAITANCLIGRRAFGGSAEPFHPAFAVTGGGDTHFFRRAHLAGATIVWADEALVYERIPASRATVRWLLQRAYRGGTSFAMSERLLHSTPWWALRRLCTGTARGIVGLAQLIPAVFRGKPQVVRALQTMCIGAGLLSGIVGGSYREYSVIHGE